MHRVRRRRSSTCTLDEFEPVRALPPLGEQRAIADYLDTETARIDALITKKRRMIELLDERIDGSAIETVMRCSGRTHSTGDHRDWLPTGSTTLGS